MTIGTQMAGESVHGSGDPAGHDCAGAAPVRILIQTVGTGQLPDPARPGDRGHPVWEALARVIRESAPDVLVQVCSVRTLRETVPRIIDALDGGDGAADVRRYVGAERADAGMSVASEVSGPAIEDDVNALFSACCDIMDGLLAEFPGATIQADFTSGTKAMSAALVAAATQRGVSSLLYAVGERDRGGRVTSTTGIVKLAPGAFMLDRTALELGRLFNEGQYDAVGRQATSMRSLAPEGTTVRLRLETLRIMASFYGAWDRFEWKRATHTDLPRNRLPKITPQLAAAGWDVERLAAQWAFANTCANEPMSLERLADLLANSARCMDRGRYDDAVARLYRLAEYIAQVRFHPISGRDFGEGRSPTRLVPAQLVARLAPSWYAERVSRTGPPRAGAFNLGMDDAFRVLAESGDPVGQAYVARCDGPKGPRTGPLGSGLNSRNESLLAHGGTPVGQAICARMWEEVRGVLEVHAGVVGSGLDSMYGVAAFMPAPWVAPGGSQATDHEA